jgi:ribosomal protein L3
MGARRVTQRGLTVVDRDPEQHLLLVKGAVPGPANAVVVVREDS